MRFSDEAVLRLLVAVVLGAAIGIEREATQQPAGLRTHIAVCMGACLFGVISTLGFEEFEEVRAGTNVQVDVTRVASQVVLGIGFLGAGIIFRQGTVVRNLTTAASLWVTCAVGLACGVGDVGTAAVATGIILVALVALLPLRTWIRRHVARDKRQLRIRLAPGVNPGDLIGDLHSIGDVEVKSLVVERKEGDYVVAVELRADRRTDIDERVSELAARADIVELGELAGKET